MGDGLLEKFVDRLHEMKRAAEAEGWQFFTVDQAAEVCAVHGTTLEDVWAEVIVDDLISRGVQDA